MTKIVVKEVGPGKQDVPIRITEEYEVASNFVQFYSGTPQYEMTPDLMREIYAE